jgi:hypothetical protein
MKTLMAIWRYPENDPTFLGDPYQLTLRFESDGVVEETVHLIGSEFELFEDAELFLSIFEMGFVAAGGQVLAEEREI